MDTASPLVFRRARDLGPVLVALAAAGFAVMLLAFVVQSVGAGTAVPLPEVQTAPFRWHPLSDRLG